MVRITIFNRTTRKEGAINLRFRLTDGRSVQLYHKSGISVDLRVLEKFTPTGEIKPRCLVDPKLADSIANEISAMKEAYERMTEEGLAINGETFEKCVDEVLHPNKVAKKGNTSFLEDFQSFVEDNYRDGVIGDGRLRLYRTTIKVLTRFLSIKGLLDITTAAVTGELILDYRRFLRDEYKYVARWSGLYVGMNERAIPRKPRSQNTISEKLSQLQTFFSEVEVKEVISRSPFRALGKAKKSTIFTEKYNDPIYLTFEEFEKLRTADVPENLRETRDAFVVQCSLGCRISDFQTLGRKDIAVTDDGIAYVRYTPQKTSKIRELVETPLLDYAIEVWKNYGFRFRVTKVSDGCNGYNSKLKKLFEEVGLTREVAVFNEVENKNEYVPLYSVASNKLARKTYVTTMARAQVNLYAAGLHKEGSSAVNHYVKLDIKDRFTLALAAFNRKFFTTDKELNIIR